MHCVPKSCLDVIFPPLGVYPTDVGRFWMNRRHDIPAISYDVNQPRIPAEPDEKL
jgi:hypothetical protein